MSNEKSTRKQTIKLREKDLVNGNKSLYLDIWHNGKRKYEFLKLYIVPVKNSIDRAENKKTLQLAESIRAKRQLELKSQEYGFQTNFKLDALFLDYFKDLADSKNTKGNQGNWFSSYKYLQKYCDPDTTFRDVDVAFVEGFKHYLENEALTKSQKPLSTNSKVSYFNKLRAAINKAFEDKVVDNPIKRVKGIKAEDPERQYLTIDELRRLVSTECKFPVLKQAFLFSCLTGLRWSDINKLVWAEVQDYNEGHRIVFKQQKTKGQEYLDISDQAFEYLGERGRNDERVFIGLKYSAWHNIELQRWVERTGINKEITFHCARHTFAVMMLDNDVSIYTVSKLLGHSDLKTTQIYAKVLDKEKKRAVDKFPPINF